MRKTPLRKLLTFLFLFVWFVGGCDHPESDPVVEQTRRELQFDRYRQALNILAGKRKLSPEGHYLKAVALAAFGQYDAAESEIQTALESEPQNPKYRGFQLRVRLFQQDKDAIEPLIELSRQYPSSAAVALFSVFAREAKTVRTAAQGQPRAAEAQVEFIQRSLRTALLLAEEIPEFHTELIALAWKYGLSEEALSIAERLVAAEPRNEKAATLLVQTLVAAGRFDEAATRAQELYRRDPDDLEMARLLGRVLARTAPSSQRDRAFEDLVARFPLDADLALQYSIYLTRAGRLREACKRLAELAQKHPKRDVRYRLINACLSLPLDAKFLSADERAEIARQQLQRYRDQLTEPLLVTYYEGRLLYLQGRYEDALKKLLLVVEQQRKDPARLQSLAAEALQWIRRILTEATVSEQLKRAVEAVERLQSKALPQATQNQPISPTPTEPPEARTGAAQHGPASQTATSSSSSPAPPDQSP